MFLPPRQLSNQSCRNDFCNSHEVQGNYSFDSVFRRINKKGDQANKAKSLPIQLLILFMSKEVLRLTPNPNLALLLEVPLGSIKNFQRWNFLLKGTIIPRTISTCIIFNILGTFFSRQL